MHEQTIDKLSAAFGLGDTLRFRALPLRDAQLVFLEVETAAARARVCLQGAQLATWQPRSQHEPVVWCSPVAPAVAGKSLRGGIPICWPWFGPHPAGAPYPNHGFARTRDWRLASTAQSEDEVEIVFDLRDDEASRALWPHSFHLRLRLLIGERLHVSLRTTATGDGDLAVGEALHTYFRVGDIGQVRVEGLDGVGYVDAADAGRRGRQAGAIRFAAETDRVFLDVPPECRIVDPALRRRILIRHAGAGAAVVWNPWEAKAQRLGDLGPGAAGQGGWRDMLCVESANALERALRIPAGQSHELSAQYEALPL